MSVGDNCPNSCCLQPLNSLPVEAAEYSHQGGPLASVPRTVQLCSFLELQGGAVSAEVWHALLGTTQSCFTNLTVVQGYSLAASSIAQRFYKHQPCSKSAKQENFKGEPEKASRTLNSLKH